MRTIFVMALMMFGAYYAILSAFGGILLYLWVAYFRPESWVWNVALVRSLNLSLLAGAYVVLRAPMAAQANYRMNLRTILLFSVIFLATLSTLTSSHATVQSAVYQDFMKALIITYLLSALTTTPRQMRLALLVIAFSLGFENAKQGWANLLLNPGGKNSNPVASLGDENDIAVGLFMVAPVFFGLARTATRQWEKRLHQFMGVGVAYRALSTYSRGGFLSAGMMIAMYIARSKYRVRSAIFATVITAGLLSVLPDAFWARMQTISVDESEMESSSAGRVHFWRVATVMANDNPILGVGVFGYEQAFDTYDFMGGLYGKKRAVHSSWFGMLAEMGYPGIVLFLTVLGLGVAGCEAAIKRAKKGDLSAELGEYAIAIQTGLAVFCIGGSFVTFQYREIVWHWIGLSMAVHNMAVPAEAPAALKVNLPPRFARNRGLDAPSPATPSPVWRRG